MSGQIAAVGDRARLKHMPQYGVCEVLAIESQGVLVVSLDTDLEPIFCPPEWILKEPELEAAPVTVPEPIPVPASRIDPETGLWIPPAPGTDTGAL